MASPRLLWLLALLSRIGYAADVYPKIVKFGGTVQICASRDTSATYFIGLGSVSPGRCQSVTVKRPTTVVAILEDDSTSRFEFFKIGVEGARGSEACTFSYDKFRHVLDGTVTVHSVENLWRTLHDILQNDMRYSAVEPMPLSSDRLALVTQCAEKPYLVVPSDRGIRARRAALAIEMGLASRVPAEVRYTIRAVVQYQRRGEQQWRDESDMDFYRDEAERAQQRLITQRP